MGLGFRKCVHNCHGQQEKKCTLFECQGIFSAKVLIGDTSLAPTGDYPRIPRGGQLSRKKRQWPKIDPILVTFGQMKFCRSHHSYGDVTRNDSQRRFLAQHSITTLLRHYFEWLKHCSNIATLCCAKNHRCESSRVTSPLLSIYVSTVLYNE